MSAVPERDWERVARSLVRSDRTQMRSQLTRSSRDMLVGGNDPSGQPPFLWWYGLDGGAGAVPIGPNGPWTAESGGLPAVTRATSLIVDPLAQTPWMVRKTDEQEPEQAPRWVRDPQLLRPDLRAGQTIWPHVKRLSRAAFWAQTIRSALWWGMGGLIFAEAEDGSPQPGSMYNLHRWAYSITDGRLTLDNDGWDSVTADADGRFQIGPVTWRVVLLRDPHSPVDKDGQSFGVFDRHPTLFQTQTRVQEYERGTYGSGVPAGYLKTHKPGTTQAQAEELKSKWMAAHGGASRSIAVLNSTTDFHALSMSPVDAELVGVKQSSLVDIANAFNLDPSFLGGPSGNSSTYANVSQYYSGYLVHTLGRWQVDIEETLSQLLPHGQELVIDLRALLRGDTSTRYDQYSKALSDKWMTVDEVREREGLPPMPESEKPENNVPAQLLPFTGGDEGETEETDDEVA